MSLWMAYNGMNVGLIVFMVASGRAEFERDGGEGFELRVRGFYWGGKRGGGGGVVAMGGGVGGGGGGGAMVVRWKALGPEEAGEALG